MSSPHLFEVVHPCFWGISQMHRLGFCCVCAFLYATDVGNVAGRRGDAVCASGGVRIW